MSAHCQALAGHAPVSTEAARFEALAAVLPACNPDWSAWWNSVSPEFVFLACLPIVLGAAGMLTDRWRQRRGRRPLDKAVRT